MSNIQPANPDLYSRISLVITNAHQNTKGAVITLLLIHTGILAS